MVLERHTGESPETCHSTSFDEVRSDLSSWIDSIRNMALGGLIFGFTFAWSDLLCYALGVGLGIMADFHRF
jgi:hypothetical protein